MRAGYPAAGGAPDAVPSSARGDAAGAGGATPSGAFTHRMPPSRAAGSGLVEVNPTVCAVLATVIDWLIVVAGSWLSSPAWLAVTTQVPAWLKVTEPVAVRYAWADNPVCNLFSDAGLVVSHARALPIAQLTELRGRRPELERIG